MVHYCSGSIKPERNTALCQLNEILKRLLIQWA